LLDQYGMTFFELDRFRMAVEQQCQTQLSFIHGKLSFGQLIPGHANTGNLYVEPIQKKWPACLLSIASTPDPPEAQDPNDTELISPPGPMVASISPLPLQSSVGIHESRTNKSTGSQTIVVKSSSSPQPSYSGESQEGIDEDVISSELDEDMEIDPSSFVDNGEDDSMKPSLTLQTMSPAKLDQVPDLSGLVVKAEPNAIFDGTYSTVFRGFYGHREVCISDIYVFKLIIPRWLSK
jgi:hypothetical protein